MSTRLPFFVMLALAQAVCAQGVQFPSIGGADLTLPVTSIRQARVASTLLQQYDFSCGSAAIATLLTHHYGIPIDEQTVFLRMYEQGDQAKIQREGFSLLDMKRFLASLGFEADGFEQPLHKLQEARIPAIVLINQNGYQHFVVIKGLKDDRVLLGDPSQGTRAMPLSDFEALWQSKLLFVIHNRTAQARFNVAADWRVAPRAPLGTDMARALGAVGLPRNGPGDF